MSKKREDKIITVREHSRQVAVSRKNPDGITIVDEHSRRIKGTFLDSAEIDLIYKNYDFKKLVYPTPNKLTEYKNADKYDDLIAIWTDYFNKKFIANPALDPDVVKALIASESSFRLELPENKIAIGIAQITKKTLKILQDPTGETKDFIFYKIRQKDLKNPMIAIPMAIRWLFRKRETAASKLGRAPDYDEIILEYKGLLKSKSEYKNNALLKYRKEYEKLKKK